MNYAFQNCVVDTSTFELHRKGRPIKLEPKVFDVLVYLIERRDRVVTKHELLDALWPGEAVSDSVLPRCIAAARRAVGDTRTRQRVIQTMHGRGYRFVAELDDPSEGEPAAVDAEAAPTSPPAARTAAATPEPTSDFVGREDALARLEAAREAANRGRGNLALVVGEPGIGKTRIANEEMDKARAAGMQVLLGRCYEGEGAPAYWPWIQVLRSAIEATADGELEAALGHGASDIADLVPEIRARIAGIPETVGPTGEQARFRLYDAATRFLASRSRTAPLLIVLDDLHWADASSLGLLRFLARELSNHPIAVVGTYRDVEVRRGHPLADTLGALAREAPCERIALGGLAVAEIDTFVRRQTDTAPHAKLAETLQEITDGNPFFLREMVRLLADQQDLSEADPANLTALALPQGVRDAVGRRLTAMSDECNTMLRAAAVLGRHFSTPHLATMLSLPDDDGERLLELLGEALDAGAIVEAGHGGFSFVHALTRQTLYEELRAPQRIALHRRAGLAIEAATRNDAGERLTELAHHFFEAAPGGDVQKAVDYGVAAARRARDQHAYDEAVVHYERALEALELSEADEDHQRTELMLALGEQLFTAGLLDRTREQLLATADRARAIGRPDLMSRAAIALRGFGQMGAPATEDIVALIHECLEAIDEDAIALRSLLTARLAGIGPLKMDRRDALSREALELAYRSDDPIAIRESLSARWWATLGPDKIEERFETSAAMRELVERTGDLHTLLLSYECDLGAHLILGNREAVEETIGRYEEVAREIRQPVFIFMSKMMRIAALMNAGRFEEAEVMRSEAEEYGEGRVPFAYVAARGQFHWSLFHSHVSEEVRRNSADDLGTLVDEYLTGTGVGELFGVAIQLRSYERDDDDLRRKVIDVLDSGMLEKDEHWLTALGVMCDVSYALQDRDVMERLYDMLHPYRELMQVHDLLRASSGSVHSPLGELATGLGRYDEALAHYERALERERESGTLSAIPSSQLGIARVYAVRREPGDRERAAALLEEVVHLDPAGGRGGLAREIAALRDNLAE